MFTDADHTKLNGIEASATADQTGSQIEALVNHDNLQGFVANEHIDWTSDQGSTNIHTGNYTNTEYSVGDGGLTQNNFNNTLKSKLDGIAASANNYVHPNHSGEVTSSADGATVVADNVIDEANLKVSNSPTNGYMLTAQSGNTGGLTWAEAGSGGASAIDDLSDALTNSSGGTIGFGTGALAADDGSANKNTAVGKNALNDVTTGVSNNAFGNEAGASITTGSHNQAIGQGAMAAVTTASSNLAIGTRSMEKSTGANNTFIGKSSGEGGSGGGAAASNSALGYSSLEKITSGSNNVAVGYQAGLSIAAGTSNTMIGSTAGDALVSGNNVTCIGNNSAASSTTVSNEITLGDTNVTKFRVPGAGFQVTSGAVIATGDITAFGSLSDIRLKENIEPITNALDKVLQIGGYTFNYKKNPDVRMTGVIAQEVEKVLPEVIYTTAEIDSEKENLAVRYENMVGLLIEAIKELKAEVDTLKRDK